MELVRRITFLFNATIILLFGGAYLAWSTQTSNVPHKDSVISWVQLVPALHAKPPEFPVDAIVRVVTDKNECPRLTIQDDHSRFTLDMVKRRNSWREAFPITVCETRVPTTGKRDVLIGNRKLPIPDLGSGEGIRKVIFLGDSGCRGTHDPKNVQFCDRTNWPFRDLAIKAANQNPDLVIHVGDYFYRGQDDWHNWQADFFIPARELLLAAPWVMVEGS